MRIKIKATGLVVSVADVWPANILVVFVEGIKTTLKPGEYTYIKRAR